MSETKTVVLRMAAEDFERLEAEARRLGVRPGTAARILLRQHLCERKATLGEPPAAGRAYDEETARRAIEALAHAQEVTQGAGPVDVVRLVREGRRDLDRRWRTPSR